jgi:hypothetical protein
MARRTLGQGLTIPAIGLGSMGMSARHGLADEREALAAGDFRRTQPLWQENQAALVVRLTPGDLAWIAAEVAPAAGERHDRALMTELDR